MAPPSKVNFDDHYDESADEDYRPDSHPNNTSEQSESEADNGLDINGKQTSGDEAILKRGRGNHGGASKKSRKRKRRAVEQVSDQGTRLQEEVSSVRTRSQAFTRAERIRDNANDVPKPAADIDAIFAAMTGKSPSIPTEESNVKKDDSSEEVGATFQGDVGNVSKVSRQSNLDANQGKSSGEPVAPVVLSVPPGQVRITRVYEFAGEVMKEEKTVSADSAEAKLYISEQEKEKRASTLLPRSANGSGATALRRPKKRKSAFGDNHQAQTHAKDTKLNTIQKSRLDWAAHVDEEGIGEELDEHSKAKEGYLSRMDFLGRMGAKRDEQTKKR